MNLLLLPQRRRKRCVTALWLLACAATLQAAEPRPEPPPPPPASGSISRPSSPEPPAPSSPSPDSGGAQNLSRPWNSGSGGGAWGNAFPNEVDPLAGPDFEQVQRSQLVRFGPGGKIRLTMVPDVSTPVRYELFDGSGRYRFELLPGQQQKLAEDRVWGIRFHRGLGEEHVSYRLVEGEYAFGRSALGWELYLIRTGSVLPPTPPRLVNAPQPLPDGGDLAPAPPAPVAP